MQLQKVQMYVDDDLIFITVYFYLYYFYIHDAVVW